MRISDPEEFLRHIGQIGDGPYDIARAALMLSALDHPDRDLQTYEAHLHELSLTAKNEMSGSVTIEEGGQSLAALMSRRFGYEGDRLSYDDMSNADIMTVIDRKRGLPVALGILYLHVARAVGFLATGLNSPNHFLLSISQYGDEIWLDPFNQGAIVMHRDSPPSLVPGLLAPDSRGISQAVSDSDVLLRLLNNIKLRSLDRGDLARALEIGNRMTLFAPHKPELWIDLGRIYEASGAMIAARKAYESCLSIANDHQLYNEAVLRLRDLNRRVN